MAMLKAIGRVSVPYMAYVSLLMALVSLGVFVVALATGSDLAGFAGVGLVACLGGAVAGFRVAARKSREASEPGNHVSIFSVPLRRDQIDQYLENYRGGTRAVPQPGRVTVLAGRESMERDVSRESGRKLAHAGAAAPGLSSA